MRLRELCRAAQARHRGILPC